MTHDELKLHIEKLERMQSEQIRLLRVISYTMWLREHGLDYEEIKSVVTKPICPTVMVKQMVKNWFRKHNLPMPEKIEKAISYRLKDGSEVCLPWPPYDADVVVNKSRLTEIQCFE